MRNISQAVRRTSVPAEILHGCRAGTLLVCTAAAALLVPGAFAQDAKPEAASLKPEAVRPEAKIEAKPAVQVKPETKSEAKPVAKQDAVSGASEKNARADVPGEPETRQEARQEQPSYSDKESGDRARAEMDYGTAASFYRRYRANAEQRNDAAAVKDAYACELDALILANLADSAQKLLDEYRAKIPNLDEKSVNLWQAEIYLIQRKADDADKLLQKLIPSLEKLDPARFRAITSAAFVAELKGDNAATAKYYGELAADAGVKTAFGRRAAERQALALAVLGKFTDAYDLLKTLPVAENKRDVDAHRLLTFYLTLAEKGPENLEETWGEIRSISSPSKDNFFFLAACRIGDEFYRRDEFVRAAEAFHLAYGFAAVREDAFTALKRLMYVFDRLGEKKEAAELAMRMLSLFKDVQLSPDFKRKIASVLFHADRTDDAFDVCLSCISDSSVPQADREKAYRGALDVMIREKAFPSAYKFIDAFDTVPENKPARDMDRAEVKWREGKPAEAAKLYRAVGEASRDKAFRQEALLNAMRSCQDARQYQDMLDIAALLRKDDPEHPDPEVLHLSAIAQFFLGDKAAAARNYLDYEATVPKTKDNKYTCEMALFQAGQLLSELGQPAKAAEVFRRLCQDYDRNDGKSRYWLIHCLYASGDEIGVERETWQFIEEKPDSQYAGAAMLRLAEHYRGTGSVQNAESTLNELLKLDKYPKIHARVIYEKALISFQRDDLAGALEYLDQLDVTDTENVPVADVHYLRGDIARALNDFANARTEYEAAAKAAAGTRLEQAALGSAADCIYALAAEPAPTKSASAAPESAGDKEKSKEVKEAEEKPATPAENYRKAFEAYQALLEKKNLLPEYKAMATYKSGQSLWKAGDEKAAFDLFKQMIYLVPARDAAVRPVESYWVFRAVEALEALAHKDPTVSNVESAVSALVWLGQAGTADQASVRQRIRALRKKQYQPPLPASSNTTTSPESKS